MKKKALWISLAIGFLALIILFGILAYFFIDARKADELMLNIEPASQINYNNYIYYNQVDFKGDQFAWQKSSIFGSKLTLLDKSGESSVLNGVNAPFQLLENRVVFKKNGSLWQRAFSTMQDKLIAKDVFCFIAMEHTLFYVAENTLFQYKWNDGKITSLGENAYSVFLHQDQIHMLDMDGQLMRLEPDGTWNKLCSIPVTSLPYCVMSYGEYVIYKQENNLIMVDPNTSEAEIVRITDHPNATDHVSYICDDSRLFVSFQATKSDGSIVRNVDYEDNGVWNIDYETKEKRKICDEAFYQLYLFEGNQLFGVKDNHLYRIDIDTGRVTEISD